MLMALHQSKSKYYKHLYIKNTKKIASLLIDTRYNKEDLSNYAGVHLFPRKTQRCLLYERKYCILGIEQIPYESIES